MSSSRRGSSRRSSSKSSSPKRSGSSYGNTAEAEAFRKDQRQRFQYYNEAVEKQNLGFEGPLQNCLRETDRVNAKLQSLELAYAQNEKKLRSASTELARQIVAAILVGILLSVVVALVVYGVIVGQSRK